MVALSLRGWCRLALARRPRQVYVDALMDLRPWMLWLKVSCEGVTDGAWARLTLTRQRFLSRTSSRGADHG